MEKFKLKLESREGKTPNQLRREGKIPATLYGAQQPSENAQLCAKEFSSLPAAALSHIIELDFAGKKVNALVRNVQRKATTHQVLNLELLRVLADRKLTVNVPLKFTGVSPAVQAGGQLVDVYQEAEIECLPGDIPDFIEVSIAEIKEIDQGIHFSQLKVSDKIKILNPADEIVVRVVAPRASAATKEEAAPAAAAAATPAS
jgi:large subunit ribosomal protein L25